MNIPKQISLKCLFCGLILDVDEKIVDNIKSGDQVKCNHCGEFNDFDSMVKVVEEEATKLIKKEAEKLIQESFGKLFK